jgi:hypothetical protein
MVPTVERKVEEIEKRVSWLEAKVDDIEKTLYILTSSIIALGIRTIDPNPTSLSIGFSVIYFTLAGLAIYKLTVPSRKRKPK